jgi:opacity protein-like surface antigen
MHLFKTASRTLILPFLCLTVAQTSYAEGFTITPLVGVRTSDSLEDEVTEQTIDIDNSSSLGFILSMQSSHDTAYDLYYSRQETDLSTRSIDDPNDNLGIKIEYIHIGGTVDYEVDKLYPFITGGLGVTRISATDIDTSTESKFSLSVGGGLKVPITKRVGLRFEGRALGTSIDGNGSALCNNGHCAVQFKGSIFLQIEASLGLSIAF